METNPGKMFLTFMHILVFCGEMEPGPSPPHTHTHTPSDPLTFSYRR